MSTHNPEQLANLPRRYSAFGTMLLIVGGFILILVGNTPVQTAGGAMLLLALITPSLGKSLLPTNTDVSQHPSRNPGRQASSEARSASDSIGRDKPFTQRLQGNQDVPPKAQEPHDTSEYEPEIGVASSEIYQLAQRVHRLALREQPLPRTKFEAYSRRQLERFLLRRHTSQHEDLVPSEVLEAEIHLGVEYALQLYDAQTRRQATPHHHKRSQVS